MPNKLADNVIKRLTLYHFILDDCETQGLEYISSPQIAELLGIDDSLVRKDIKLVNNCGKCKIGYEIKPLKACIEHTLGFRKIKDAVIVGAGNLGSALIRYDDLEQYGFNIVALFDNDSSKVGQSINSRKVHHISEITKVLQEKQIRIGILTVPKGVAQECTDILVQAGIKYIWNFTPRVLNVPNDVRVWNENLIGNLLSAWADES